MNKGDVCKNKNKSYLLVLARFSKPCRSAFQLTASSTLPLMKPSSLGAVKRDKSATTWQIPSFVFLHFAEPVHILFNVGSAARSLDLGLLWFTFTGIVSDSQSGKKRGRERRGERKERTKGKGSPWRRLPKCRRNISFSSASASGCRTRRAPRFS